jgi:hypothetical protein
MDDSGSDTYWMIILDLLRLITDFQLHAVICDESWFSTKSGTQYGSRIEYRTTLTVATPRSIFAFRSPEIRKQRIVHDGIGSLSFFLDLFLRF